MARTMQDLLEGVFINVANLTMTRKDSYLDYLKAGIKQDTLNALRTAPLHMSALFPDHLISKAEEEIRHHEDKRTSGASHKGSQHFHPYHQPSKQQQPIRTGNPVCLHGNSWVEGVDKDLTGVKLLLSPSDLLRHRSSINDNYCAQFVTGTVSPVLVTGQIKSYQVLQKFQSV